MSGAVLFWIILYLSPSAIALLRGHHNAAALIALNVLLGWTVAGWIAAFVWSLTTRPEPVVVNNILPAENNPPDDSHLVTAKRHIENIFEACREISDPALNVLLVAAQADGKISRDDLRLIARFFAKQGADIKEAWLESISVLNTGITINLGGNRNCDSEIAALRGRPLLFKIALYGTFTALTGSNKRLSKTIEAMGSQLEAIVGMPEEQPETPAPTIEASAPLPIETPPAQPPAPVKKPSWVEEAKAEIEAERRRKQAH